jgi:hypothetical protein
MARQKIIKITISPTGEVSFEVNGVPGKACVGETKFLEEAVGGQVLSQEKTGEYYQEEVHDVVTTHGKT